MSRDRLLRRASVRRRAVLPVVAATVFGAAWSAVALAPDGAPTGGWWPAAGLCIAVMVLAPRRVAVAVPLVAVPLLTAAIWLGGRAPEMALAFAVANAVEILLAGALIRRTVTLRGASGAAHDPSPPDRPAPRLRMDQLWWVGLSAALGALACATIVGATFWFGGEPAGWSALRNVMASHLAGTLLVVPAALALRGRAPAPPRWETVAQLTILVVVLLATLVAAPDGGVILALAPLPLLVWAGLRLGTPVVIGELLLVAVAITAAARLGSGPFETRPGDVATAYLFAALVQSSIICAIFTALPLSVTMDQRRELLHRVLANERRLRRSFSESVVGMLELNDDGTELVVGDLNDVASRMFGGGRSDVLGRRLSELMDLPGVELRERVRSGAPWRDEVSLVDRPGTRIGIAVSGGSSTGADGATASCSAQLVDLTPEHEAHRRAERERELSRAVAETAACLILLVDVDGVLVAANPAAAAMLGWTEDELVGRFVWELLPADRQGALRRAIADLPASPLPVSSEADLLCRDGGRRRVLWSTEFARDPDGSPTLLVMTGIDVTAERQQKLLVSQLLEAAMTTAIIGTDSDGRIAFFNTGAQRLLGLTAEAAVGSPFVDVLDADECAERFGTGPMDETPEEAFFRVTLDLDPNTPPVPEDMTWCAADGTRRTVSTTLSMVSDPDLGVGFLCIGRDVTEQRQTQELLMAALDKERTAVERLQALDHAKNDFVSTVSHELRTPVTSIVGYAEMLRDGTVDEPRPDQAPFLAAIARNADRLIRLADDLLTLSGLESGAAELGRETVDLGELVERAQESLSPLLLGRDLATTYTRPEEPVLVSGDVEHLDRVLVNLVGNAVKFTDDGGRIDIAVRAEAGEAVLTVSDTGIGIPDDEQARLFTKFFRSTTAQQRAIQGTGLGLSIVHSVVAAHGGRILVRSAHLAGTTFAVRLPLHGGEISAPRPTTRGAVPAPGTQPADPQPSPR